VQQTQQYATETLQEMEKRAIDPTPENYSVWYAVVTGGNAELRKQVEVMASNDQEFDKFRNQSLFEEYILPDLASGAIASAGDDLESIVYRLNNTVGEAGESAEKYGEALAQASDSLGAGGADVQAIVGSLMAETKAMQDRNAALQAELSESTSEIDTLREKLEDSKREAETDGLTGIANRKRFDRSLDELSNAAEASGETLCLLMVDIDFFKKFNDSFGHQTGDQVLKLVARTLSDCVREEDVAARYGGEEFSVILPRADLVKAWDIGERIRTQVGAKKIMKRSTNEDLGTITLSVGVSIYRPGEPVANLMKRADDALYLCKESGRNQVLTEEKLPG
jgi:diguanylate cyclase